VTNSRERNRKVLFQRDTPTTDDYGGEVSAWKDLGSEWAKVTFGTGQERRAAAQEQATLTATFEVPRNSKTATLTPKDRIQLDGSVWDITSVVPSRTFNAGIDVTGTKAA
jgi:SPP1 family predicted phage head-tail adaptor